MGRKCETGLEEITENDIDRVEMQHGIVKIGGSRLIWLPAGTGNTFPTFDGRQEHVDSGRLSEGRKRNGLEIAPTQTRVMDQSNVTVETENFGKKTDNDRYGRRAYGSWEKLTSESPKKFLTACVVRNKIWKNMREVLARNKKR